MSSITTTGRDGSARRNRSNRLFVGLSDSVLSWSLIKEDCAECEGAIYVTLYL